MQFEFRLPDLGEGLEDAEIVLWLVGEGGDVARDQALVEVETDKAAVTLPSPVAGRISSLGAAVGERLRVGDVLVVIDDVAPGDQPPPLKPGGYRGSSGLDTTSAGQPEGEDFSQNSERDHEPSQDLSRPKAAPAVRRLASQLGVNLEDVRATGPDGRVTAEDVRKTYDTQTGIAQDDDGFAAIHSKRTIPSRASESAPPGLGQAIPGRHPLRGIRRRIADIVTEAWLTIPHITGFAELDATELLTIRRQLRTRLTPPRAEALTLLPFLVAACAQALRQFPLVNASLDMTTREIVVHERCNIGIAVATEAGLVVPVINDADMLSLMELAEQISLLVASARRNSLSPANLSGGTFTVTNYGTFGGQFATPIIRPPECAIMGFGAIRDRVIAIDGQPVVRPTLPLSFSVDHRLIDGDLSAVFRAAVAAVLEAPAQLLLHE